MVFTVFGYTISWTLVGTVLALFVGREVWTFTYLKRKGIVGPVPLPFIGNLKGFTKGLAHFMRAGREKYGEVFGMYMFRDPIVIISDLDMLKDIMIKSFSKFVNHKAIILDSKPFDQSLFNLHDQRWKDVRNIITPTFSAVKMKQMSPLINECCDNLIANFAKKQEKDNEVNVNSLFEAFTMDGIAKCAFGLQVDSQNNPDDPFVKFGRSITNGQLEDPKIMIAGIFPSIAYIMNKLGIGFVSFEAQRFFRGVCVKAMEMRTQTTGNPRKDFLQLMMNAHEDEDHRKEKTKEDIDENDLYSRLDVHHDSGIFESKKTKTKLSVDDIYAQALLFFVAGFETTNTTLGFIAYSLATNPEIQDKLIEEVDEVTPTRDSVNYNSVAKMPYLDSIVCETLRMYPPAEVTDRICSEKYTYNGTTIEKGMQIFINVFGIHRNPEIWQNPDTFDPTRFSKENSEGRHPFAWIPFGAGPRICVGMRFALMEIKMAVVRMLQNYRFETSKSSVVPIQLGVLNVKPPKGIYLRVAERN